MHRRGGAAGRHRARARRRAAQPLTNRLRSRVPFAEAANRRIVARLRRVTEYQVTRWRELPSMVAARAGDETVKAELAPRFQEAIDEAAMRLGDTGADDYLAGWERTAVDRGRRYAGRGARPGRRRARRGVAGRPDRRLPRRAGPVNRLAALLGADRPVLLDGGMGTLLQDRGLEDGAPGELWNLENPDAVRAAHAAYAEAGARLLTTNTFGGTRPRLDMHGLGDRLAEVNRNGGAARPVGGRRARTARRRRPRPDRRAAGAARDPDARGGPGAVRRAARRAGRGRDRPGAGRDAERPRRGRRGPRRGAARSHPTCRSS